MTPFNARTQLILLAHSYYLAIGKRNLAVILIDPRTPRATMTELLDRAVGELLTYLGTPLMTTTTKAPR